MLITDIPLVQIGSALGGFGAMVTSYVLLRRNHRDIKSEIIGQMKTLNDSLTNDMKTLREDAATQKTKLDQMDGQMTAMKAAAYTQDQRIRDMQTSLDRQERFILTVKNSAKSFGFLIGNEGDLSLPSSITVLVVGNEGRIREATQELLINHGFSVVVAKSRNDALNLISTMTSSTLGVIIVDVLSFKSDSYEFVNTVRRMPGYNKIAFILALEFGDPSSRSYLSLDKELPEKVFLFPVPFNRQQLVRLVQDISSVIDRSSEEGAHTLPSPATTTTTTTTTTTPS